MKLKSGYWLSTLQVEIHNPIPSKVKVYNEGVVGSTYEGRQAVVRKLQVNETIQLRREPNNPYDANAIRVERIDGEQFGYINRYLAKKLAPQMDAMGVPVLGHIYRISVASSPYYSLVVDITFEMPEGGGLYEQSEADL
jgi:hypothetical protein